jgi:hypothetical protein
METTHKRENSDRENEHEKFDIQRFTKRFYYDRLKSDEELMEGFNFDDGVNCNPKMSQKESLWISNEKEKSMGASTNILKSLESTGNITDLYELKNGTIITRASDDKLNTGTM